jgi:hypothetical protein
MKEKDRPDSLEPPTPTEGREPEGSSRAAFAPPVRDAAVAALLKGLNPTDVAPSTETASTDGELSAAFSAPPRDAPSAVHTPAPEPSVVVGPDKTPPKTAAQPKRQELDTTFRLRDEKPSLVVPVLLAILIGGGGAGLWVWFHEATKPVSRPLPAATTPAPSPAPNFPPTPVVTAAPEPPPPVVTAAPAPPPAPPTTLKRTPSPRPSATPTKQDDESLLGVPR